MADLITDNSTDPESTAEPSADPVQRATVRISGYVQGVYYRSAAIEQARVLALRGVVRNLPSGTVELIAEGTLPELQQLIAWCHLGPPAARVDNVAVRFAPATHEYADFRVLQKGTATVPPEGPDGIGEVPVVVTSRSSDSGS